MPSLAELEQWLEQQLPDELQSLPGKVHVTIQSYTAELMEHLQEFTPSMAQIESSLPSIPFVNGGTTSAPKPVPILPWHLSVYERVASQVDRVAGSRRRTSIAMSIAFVGLASTATYYSLAIARRRSHRNSAARLRSFPRVRNGVRCDAVVVLGADTPLGEILSQDLAAQGFIVLASVATEKSKQAYDALILPSMRGYIKTIILPIEETQADHVARFAQEVNAARELRWPLTAAGDPYARPGTEVDLVAVVNALSYASPLQEATPESANQFGQSTSALNADRIAEELRRRVITPLTVARALLPLLSRLPTQPKAEGRVGRHSDELSARQSPAVVLSLAHPAGATDMAMHALIAGMRSLSLELDANTKSVTKATQRMVSVVTLQSRASSLSNRLATLWPAILGGRAISGSHRRALRAGSVSRPSVSSQRSYTASSAPGEPKSDGSDEQHPTKRSAVLRQARLAEHKAVSNAALQLLSDAAAAHTARLLDSYFVQIALSDSSSQVSTVGALDGRTMSAVVHASLHALGTAKNIIGGLPLFRLLSNRYSTCYSGTRNVGNTRPAFGPGPGPASNTHSRSCIRGSNQTSEQPPRRRTASGASSEHARSSGSESGGARGSAATASAPPSSAHDMSSSGLLSSVPSSAFGDLSEEERYAESDFLDGSDSPMLGSRAGGGGPDTRLQTPSSESWQHEHDTMLSADQSVASVDDHDDSGTALGSRNDIRYLSDDTPHSSRTIAYEGERRTDESPQGGPSTDGHDSDAGRGTVPSSGAQSPLGQSWVALGRSTSSTSNTTTTQGQSTGAPSQG